MGDLIARDARNLNLERSLSAFDIRQRLTTSYIWELPFGRGKKFRTRSHLINVLLGDWQINGITTLRSGNPFTPSLGVSSAGTGYPRPDRIRDGALSRNERTLLKYFDTSAFSVPDKYNFGNAGKNILIGPGAVNFDFSLFKNFPISFLGENGLLQVRAEAYNFFNTPQFANPNFQIDVTQGGSITSLRNNMRELQFSLKMTF